MNFGKILTLDLSTGQVDQKDLEEDIIRKYLGGRGLGAHLYSQDPRPADDPDNSLFLVPGLLTGTPFASSSRMSLVTSSPLTGFLLSSSSGGRFGAYLKSQEISVLQIRGVSKKWVYLEVGADGIKIKDASDIAGKNVYETRRILARKYDGQDISIGSIGRGGENLVKYAIVQFGNRASGRAGSGWHFGFKKIKAIVVRRGELPLESHDSDKTRDLVKEFLGRKAEHEIENDVDTYCTGPVVKTSSDWQTFPASNYRRNFINEDEIDQLGYDRFKKKVVKKEACWSCPLACTRILRGKYSEEGVKGPEYETLWSLGANCDNFDLDVVIEANRICDEYGLDTISTGGALGWYKECVDKGDIDDKWTPERMFELIRQIGERKGDGEKLADGILKTAENFGVGKKYVVHAKGLDLPAWDPRAAIGMAITYATSPVGGDHRKGHTVSANVGAGDKRFDTEGKAQEAINAQNKNVKFDSLGTCGFAGFMYDNDIWSRCIEAYLGIKVTSKQLDEIAGIVFDLEYEINKELGHSLEENTLPERILGYEIEVDGQKRSLLKSDFDKMLEEYYKLRGWR
ncbi:hypothetical protein JW710_02835 [Candidatus Dojkabacteria bacterium]|nr:hypothetical protein [Candidatus Dojkabacteria bacterium]